MKKAVLAALLALASVGANARMPPNWLRVGSEHGAEAFIDASQTMSLGDADETVSYQVLLKFPDGSSRFEMRELQCSANRERATVVQKFSNAGVMVSTTTEGWKGSPWNSMLLPGSAGEAIEHQICTKS